MTTEVSGLNAVNAPPKLVAAAVVCLLLYLFLPAVDMSGQAFGIASETGSLTGSDLTGAAGWLTLVALVVASLTRFVPLMLPYRNLADSAALVLVVLTVLYAVFGSPAAKALEQVNQAQGQLSNLMGNAPGRLPMQSAASLSVTPNVGGAFFVLAPVLLLIARLRGR